MNAKFLPSSISGLAWEVGEADAEADAEAEVVADEPLAVPDRSVPPPVGVAEPAPVSAHAAASAANARASTASRRTFTAGVLLSCRLGARPAVCHAGDGGGGQSARLARNTATLISLA
jgi:hypothetical protein